MPASPFAVAVPFGTDGDSQLAGWRHSGDRGWRDRSVRSPSERRNGTFDRLLNFAGFHDTTCEKAESRKVLDSTFCKAKLLRRKSLSPRYVDCLACVFHGVPNTRGFAFACFACLSSIMCCLVRRGRMSFFKLTFGRLSGWSKFVGLCVSEV